MVNVVPSVVVVSLAGDINQVRSTVSASFDHKHIVERPVQVGIPLERLPSSHAFDVAVTGALDSAVDFHLGSHVASEQSVTGQTAIEKGFAASLIMVTVSGGHPFVKISRV